MQQMEHGGWRRTWRTAERETTFQACQMLKKKKRFHASCFWSLWPILAVSLDLADDSMHTLSLSSIFLCWKICPNWLECLATRLLIRGLHTELCQGDAGWPCFNSKGANTYALGVEKLSGGDALCLERPEKQAQRANKPHRSTREKHHLWFPHLNWPLFFFCMWITGRKLQEDSQPKVTAKRGTGLYKSIKRVFGPPISTSLFSVGVWNTPLAWFSHHEMLTALTIWNNQTFMSSTLVQQASLLMSSSDRAKTMSFKRVLISRH